MSGGFPLDFHWIHWMWWLSVVDGKLQYLDMDYNAKPHYIPNMSEKIWKNLKK